MAHCCCTTPGVVSDLASMRTVLIFCSCSCVLLCAARRFQPFITCLALQLSGSYVLLFVLQAVVRFDLATLTLVDRYRDHG